MASNPQRSSEKDVVDDYESELNISSTDELEAINALTSREAAVEVMIIRKLQRLFVPVFVPIITPLINRIVAEQIALAQQKQELLTCMQENHNASTSVPKKLKLQFRNKIFLPVFTGEHLLGENKTSIGIALVDARTGEIVNTGTESTAKLQIVGFRVGDDDSKDDSWTFEDFQNITLGEKKGKRILQGNTCLQLKEGLCFVDKISFTHGSKNTRNGEYRLGVGVVDATLVNVVEVATTEAFLMKDRRSTYGGKHPYPSLDDKVCHLKHINYKSRRYKHMKAAGVNTVEDLLTLLHTDQKQLEDILGYKASSKMWDDIVKNAQMSSGMFLCLDPSNELKTGIVLDVKLHLKGLIVEPQQYIPVEQLSDKQKEDNQKLAKFAFQHFKIRSFENQTCLEKYLHTDIGFRSTPSAYQSLGTANMIDESTSPYSQVNGSSTRLNDTPGNLNNSNLNMDKSSAQVPMLTSQSERGKGTIPFGTVTEKHAHNYPEPGTSQVVESSLDTCGNMDDFNFSENWMEELMNLLNSECISEPAYSDTNVMMMAAQTVSICTIERARTRWTNVSKLLRRNSVRERISLGDGVQVLKKQRCF